MKTCSFCNDAGHSLGSRCPNIYCWKGTMLTCNKTGTAQRDKFVKQLRNPGSAYSITMLPIDKYQSNAIHEIGQGTKSLVLHARYVMGDQLNVLGECTLLKAQGIVSLFYLCTTTECVCI